MRRTACCLLLFVAFTPAAEAKTTVPQRAERFAAKDAHAEGAAGYLVERCQRRRCCVTLYGIWTPFADYADLSGWVVIPKGRRAYWRDFG